MLNTDTQAPTPTRAPGTYGTLHIMDHSGDTKIMWDYKNEAEVDHARETFDSFKKKGYLAYKVGKDSKKGEVMTEFDPKAEKMILSPPITGG